MEYKDCKRMIDWVLDKLERETGNLMEMAETNEMRFNGDIMKAYYKGEKLGYERVFNQISWIRQYIEEQERDMEKNGKCD